MTSSRHLWARLAVFALAGIVLGAVAAVVVRDRSSIDPGAAGEPTPSIAADATASHPTTPIPSGEPEATRPPPGPPTAGPTRSNETSVVVFGRHVASVIKAGATLLDSLRRDAQAVDVKAVRADAAALSAWAAAESSWLDAHPPAACYADVHREYASAIDDLGQAAAITQRFATDFPFANFDDVQRALDLANGGAAKMQAAGDALKTVDCPGSSA